MFRVKPFTFNFIAFLLSVIHSCHADYKYNLSICAIFQDEAPYLKEWIDYHRLLGVEHFYLYNHRSQDDFQKVLQPYIAMGLIELKNKKSKAASILTFNSLQCKCYNECLSKAKGVSKWIAFVDIDEFLLPLENQGLDKILKEFEDFGGLGINWLVFGPSHVWDLPKNQLLIEALTKCAEPNFPLNRFIKSIVRPERVLKFKNPHQPIFKKGFFEVDVLKAPINGMSSPSILHKKLRINHYWSRNGEFFYNKKLTRHVSWRGLPNEESLQSLINDINSTEDKTILRYLPYLKKPLEFVSDLK